MLIPSVTMIVYLIVGGGVQQWRRVPSRIAVRRAGGPEELVGDPSVPHQTDHQGQVPRKGSEESHGVHKVCYLQ